MESGGGGELDELKSRPPQTPPKEGLASTQNLKVEIGLFAWNCTNADVVDIKFGFALNHRPSPQGGGLEGEATDAATNCDGMLE